MSQKNSPRVPPQVKRIIFWTILLSDAFLFTQKINTISHFYFIISPIFCLYFFLTRTSLSLHLTTKDHYQKICAQKKCVTYSGTEGVCLYIDKNVINVKQVLTDEQYHYNIHYNELWIFKLCMVTSLFLNL